MFKITFLELDFDEIDESDSQSLSDYSSEENLPNVDIRKLFPLKDLPEGKTHILRADFSCDQTDDPQDYRTLLIPAVLVQPILEFATNEFKDYTVDLPEHEQYENADFSVGRGNPDNVQIFDSVQNFSPHTHCLLCEENIEGNDEEYIRMEDPHGIYFLHPDCFVEFINELQDVTLDNAGKYILSNL